MLTRVCSFAILILISLINRCEANNEATNFNPLTKYAMQFIVEYANWRRLDHVIIFDPFLNQGSIPVNLLQLLDCLSQQGIYSTIYSTQVKFTPETFRIIRHRLGVVVLLKCNETLNHRHVIYRASKNLLLDEQHAWLLITCEQEDKSIWSLAQSIKLALTTDLVVAVSLINITDDIIYNADNNKCPVTLPKNVLFSEALSKDMTIYPSPFKKKSLIYDTQHKRFKDIFPDPPHKQEINISTLPVTAILFYKLIQVYKIRRDIDDSIVINTLGLWGPKNHFDRIIPFSPVEGRQDLMGFPLVVGFKNWDTAVKNEATRNGKSIFETEVDDTENMREIMEFIAKSLNATLKYVPYDSVGSEIQDGVWTGLLEAVVKGKVDIGLEKITVTYKKLEQMAFTYNIMKMSHNLYMHPSEFAVSKDIYLTPFSLKLLLCVLGMAILLAIVMFVTSVVAKRKKNEETEMINVSYAALWIVGILSMQGSVWTPISSSGNMTLIASLIFALIIYNSYAAFITSILSVRTSDIKSLEDLYANGYKVGYIKDSEDEIYLQRRDDNLKEIFHRGFNSKVASIEEGLLLAANTKYALFISTQAARRTIQDLKPYECRCQIQEFVLKQTVEDVAFPLNKSSAYMKVINLGVLRLIESGTLSRIEGYMLPGMPTCSVDSSFVSAQLDDVLTAVKLLGLGIILSIIVAVGECLIKWRKSCRHNLGLCCRKMGVTIKSTVENFEF